MGLIKQIDDYIGKLINFLEQQNRMEDTMIIFTSDHGDYLGDHWLGEKELFHEESVKIPLIIYDPSEASNSTRGTVENKLIESIDLLPTFIEVAGGKIPVHWLEGHSLLPILHGKSVKNWRNYTISESEYASRIPYWKLGIEGHEARATMVRTHDWKYIFHDSFRPELFDLRNDPHEFNDLGEHKEYETIRIEMKDMLFDSMRKRKTRTTKSNDYLKSRAELLLARNEKRHVYIGVW